MIYSLKDRRVSLTGNGHFIAPDASIIGSVTLKDSVSVWFNVVIRGDGDEIVVGAQSNIQDGSVLHVDPGFALHIGERVTVGHKVMLHGCTIGDGSLIGINAVVLNGAKIGKNCLIGANALIKENMEVPDGSMVLGSPGRIKRELSAQEQAALGMNADHYVANAARFAEQLAVDTSHD